MMRSRLTLVAGLCLVSAGFCAVPVQVQSLPTVMIPPAHQAPVLDGKLEDSCWSLAPEIGPFVRLDGGAAERGTTARLCYSDTHLFVAVTCPFPQAQQLRADAMPRDGDVFTQDCVELFIDPGPTMRTYRHLLLSAANVQRDESGDRLASPRFDVAWDAEWQSAVRIDDAAWRAELAVPLSEVGLGNGPGTLFGLNLCRNDTSGGELSCWSPTGSGFHVPHRFGLAMLAPRGRVPSRLRLELPEDLLGDTLVIKASGDGETLRLMLVGEDPGAGRREQAPLQHGSAKWTVDGIDTGLTGVVAQSLDGNGDVVGLARQIVNMPALMAQRYGLALDRGEELGLWWAPSLHKIHRWTPRPEGRSRAVTLSAAGREYEAVQLVVRPERDMTVTVTVSDLKRGLASVIPAANVQVLTVGYVPVSRPTDRFGWADDWPDPLLPLDGPVDCRREQNQPFWIVVRVPHDQRAGTYRGDIVLRAGEQRLEIPLEVEVFPFSLPSETHTRTAYGVAPPYAFLGLTSAEQRRQVYDLYMQSCREHRIAPYSPMAHYPVETTVHTPSRTYRDGDFAVTFQLGREEPWAFYWQGERIAAQRISMTHFEKEGVGWQGKGMNWPYVGAVESIEEIARTDTMCQLQITGVHTDSAPASRRYRLTFHAFVPVQGQWMAWRLTRMESLDPAPVTIRGYYNLPKTSFDAQRVANEGDMSGWTNGEKGFGMLCLDGEVSGLSAEKDRASLTVYNKPREEFVIKESESRDGWGPLVIYFFGAGLDTPAALRERANDLRDRIDRRNPMATAVEGSAQWQVEVTDEVAFEHDFSRFDEGARRYLDEFGFNGFNHRGLPGSIAGVSRFSEEYRRLHADQQGAIIEHLRQKGWLGKAYSYWYDEPTKEDYPYVIEGMQILGWNCPGLTRLLTEQPEPELADHVDLWVPVLSAFHPEVCRDRQLAGDEVWWYVCCGPRAPYPNNFIDHPGINHRIRFWMAEKYGVTGSLYWSTTYMGKTPDGEPRNPYDSPMSMSPRGTPWGNGDGFLLYPACSKPSDTPVLDPPVVSMRWELLRDGLEDREYMWLLRQQARRIEQLITEDGERPARVEALEGAKDALEAPGRLAESLTVYTMDTQALLTQRKRLAEALAQCLNVD